MNVKRLIEMPKRVTALAGAMMIGALVMFTAPAQAQNSEGAQINAALAQEAVMGILPEIPAGLGLSPADYVAGNDHSAATRLVRVRIGPDGNVMPSTAWQETHPAQCRKQGRETNDAAQVLEFKMIRNTESLDGLTRYQYFVFARLTDPEAEGEGTSIHRQGEGSSTVGQARTGRDGLMENPDAEGMGEAVREAMQNLGVNLGTPSDGCGDIRLVHLFGSVVDDQFGFLAGYQNEAAPDVTYSWDFGDGTVIAQGEQIGRHVYTTKGTYTVTVHVSGENVRDGSASIAVTVKEEEKDEPIQPRDGVWNVKLDSHETQGCAPKIASGVASAMSDMMGKNTRQTLSFETPFHPQPLMQHAKHLSWKQTGTNAWQTVVAEKGSSGMNMKVVLNLKVVSPTLIREVLDQHIKMSGKLAELIGGTADCLATGYFEVTHEP